MLGKLKDLIKKEFSGFSPYVSFLQDKKTAPNYLDPKFDVSIDYFMSVVEVGNVHKVKTRRSKIGSL